ncbi:MAG: hypothetical protein V4850_09575 [Myxococcota bacterium]
MLGEPGAGKSTEIQRAVSLEGKSGASYALTILFDLREHADESRIESVWKSRVEGPLSAGEPAVTVYIDSLDEGLLQLRTTIDLLTRLIRDTASNWPAALYVRIGCRTGAWPATFEKALTEVFYRKATPPTPWVVELADLDAEDIDLYARTCGLPATFARAIERAGAGVFARRPVTLQLLHTLFERSKDLPQSRWDLYERAILTLCVAPNARLSEKGLLPLPDARQQLECAAMVASMVVFTGRPCVFSGPGMVPVTATRVADFLAADPLQRLCDVLLRHTPIFRPGKTPGEFHFAHRTYAEFLAVWAADWREVVDADALDLVRGAGGGIVPELSEVAGWLATRRPAVLDALMESEPEVLLGGDPARLADEVQRGILLGALGRVNDQKVAVRAGAMAHSLLRIARPVLVDGLRGWCREHPGRSGDKTAFDVLLLVREAHLSELLPEVERVVLDEEGGVDARGFACDVLGEVDPTRAARFLSRFIPPGSDGRSHPLLAKAMAWAGRTLPSPDFFAAVDRIPRHQTIGGAAWHFLTYDLLSIVEDTGWQAEGLRWLARIGPRDQDHPLSLSGFERVVWRWGAVAEFDAHVLDALVEVVVSFGRAHTSLGGHEPGSGPSAALRRRLAERLLSDALPDKAHSALVHSSRWLYSKEDVGWLLAVHRTATGSLARERTRSVLRSVADLEDVRFVSEMFEAGESDHELVEGCRWFFGPVSIEEGGQAHREERRREDKLRAAVEQVGDTRERVRRALVAAERDPKVWYNLLRELTLRPGQTHYGDWANSAVTTLPGWEDATPETRVAILESARRFLDEVPPPRPSDWLGRSEFPSILLAGVAAADLVFAYREPKASFGVAVKGWSRWMPALLKLGGSARDWPRWNAGLTCLPHTAFRLVARSVATVIDSPLETEAGKQSLLDRLVRTDAWRSSAVAEVLRERLTKAGLPAAVDDAAFAALAAIRPHLATSVAKERIRCEGPKIGACKHLLRAGDAAGWSAVMEILSTNAELVEETIGGIASEERFSRAGEAPAWPTGESPNRVAELYRLVAGRFPPGPAESAAGARLIGPRENLAELRNGLPWMLAERGDRESVTALRSLVEWAAAREIDLRSALSVADQNLRRKEWKPKTAQQIAKMFASQGPGAKRSHSRRRSSPPPPTPMPLPMPMETLMTNLAPVGTAIEEVFVTGGLAPWSHVPTKEEAKLQSWISGRRPVAVVHGPTLSGKTVAVGAALEKATVKVIRLDVNREEEEAELGPILDQSLRGDGVLVVENYHMLRPKVRARLFGQLRSLVDDSAGRRRVVVVGRAVTPPDSVMDELFARVPPIVVPALRSADECRDLLLLGAKAANLEFANIGALAELAGGSLNVAQRLGLAACNHRHVDDVDASPVQIHLSASDLTAVDADVGAFIADQLARLIRSVRDSVVTKGVDSTLATNLALLTFWSARDGGRCTWQAVAGAAPGVSLDPFRDALLSSQEGASWALSVACDESGMQVHESPFHAVAARLPWREIGKAIGASAAWEGNQFILEGVPRVGIGANAGPPRAHLEHDHEPDWEESAANLTSAEDILTWMGEGLLANRGFPRRQVLRDELGTVGRQTIGKLLADRVICEHDDGTPRYRFGLDALPLMRHDVADRLLAQIRPYLKELQRLWRRHHGSEFRVDGEAWPGGAVDPGLLLAVAGWSGYMVVKWDEDRAQVLVLREDIRDADPNQWPFAAATAPTGNATVAPDTLAAKEAYQVVDVAIITVKEEEHSAVLHHFSPANGKTRRGTRQDYDVCEVATHDGVVRVAIARCLLQGNVQAQTVATDVLDDLHPRLVVVVGIAGGCPSEDFTLGDVIVSSYIHDLTLEDTGAGEGSRFNARGGPLDAEAARIVARLQSLGRSMGDWAARLRQTRPSLDGHHTTGDVDWNKKITDAFERHAREGRAHPIARAEAVASSDRVVKAPELLVAWRAVLKGVAAVEMESAGAYAACQHRGVPCFAIRGISDIVGWKRDELWTIYACETAAAYAHALFAAGALGRG